MTLTFTLTLMAALLGAPTASPAREAMLAAVAPVEPEIVQALSADDHFTVRLRCTALASGRVADCVVLEESRPDYGFGQAALVLMRDAEVPPVIKGGRPVETMFERTIDFTP